MRNSKTAALSLVLLALAPRGMLAQDMDSDGTPDALDICKLESSTPSSCAFDTDNDGIGNACDGDFDNDGVVNASDAKLFYAITGGNDPNGIGADMNCDGFAAGSADVGLFFGQFTQGVPGPSGLACAGTVPCP